MTTVLIADIGGTNARFALADDTGIHDPRTLKVADFPGPAEAARAYLDACGAKPARGVFAVAAPVTGDDVFTLTNFPWTFSLRACAAALGLESLHLINDFHAQALGAADVGASCLYKFDDAMPRSGGNIGIIGPGTGLGVAALVHDSKSNRMIAVPGEGGHVTAPLVTPREFALARWLLEHRYSHISAERVCSGKGLVNLYDAVRGVDALDLPDRTPEEISDAALAGACPACAEVLTLMLAFLGRVAGNLALTVTADAGVYLTGGILPRLPREYLLASPLRANFVAKGRQTDYISRMPLFLVDDPVLALRGLRHAALKA
ncbi:MAG: glucokinase [Rhodospirillales bacterium]|nr:glucokinase [Alphaproteobacteria bacterium]MCB9986243.1 glucokinase [Rhodospirillales bacterium]USO07202.1 MAG: glucokinase [Rhodospirillales bacterium]